MKWTLQGTSSEQEEPTEREEVLDLCAECAFTQLRLVIGKVNNAVMEKWLEKNRGFRFNNS
jgi:hypothetical protein